MKAIIFDMDGVLIDSPKYVFQAFNELLNKYGVKINDEDLKNQLSRSLRDQIEIWKRDYGLDKNINVEKFSKESYEIEMDLLKEKLKESNLLINLLNSLKKEGFKLAVATSSQKYRAVDILKILGIKNIFESIVTCEDVDKHKPNPDIFLKVAENLEVDPSECVVIEDAVNGIIAAKAANMKTIALLTEFHNKEELKDADLIIESLNELNVKKIKNL